MTTDLQFEATERNQLLQFEPAERTQLKARAAIIGPPDADSTLAALTLAESLGGPIGVVDTEHGRASSYADRFTFQHLPLRQFNPETLGTYVCAAAAHTGITVLVIDGLSAFWAGASGVLEQVDTLKGPNSTGWGPVRPRERKMWNALAAYPGHVIVTLRATVEYVVAADEDEDAPHRVAVRQYATRPQQAAGVEYDIDHVIRLNDDYSGRIKSLCPDLDGTVFPAFGPEIGKALTEWLNQGVPVKDAMDYYRAANEDGVTRDDVQQYLIESTRAGLHGAAVLGPNEEPVTLARYLNQRMNQLA